MYGIIPHSAIAEGPDTVTVTDELVLSDELSPGSPGDLTEEPPDNVSDEEPGKPLDDEDIDGEELYKDDEPYDYESQDLSRDEHLIVDVNLEYTELDVSFSPSVTTLWSEDFEGTPKMTSKVFHNAGGDVPQWGYINRATAQFPTLPSAPSGNMVARFNSFYTHAGSIADLESNDLITSISNNDIIIRFFMYHDNGWGDRNDTVVPYVRVGSSYSFADPIPRLSATTGWRQHSLRLSGSGVQPGYRFYIGFAGNSAYGRDMYIDSITVTQESDGIGGGENSGTTIIDTTSPYTGTHVVIYNSSTTTTSSQSTGTLPAADMGSLNVEMNSGLSNYPARVKDVYEIDGELIYELEPHDFLAGLTTPGIMGHSGDVTTQGSTEEIQASVIGASLLTRANLPSINRNSSLIWKDSILLYQGTYCDVWVEFIEYRDGFVTIARATQLGQEYDNRMRPFMHTNFGDYVSNGTPARNGKIIIFLEDIDCGWSGSGGFIAGFFSSAFFTRSDIRLAMVNVDIYPLMCTNLSAPNNPANYNITYGYPTLVHEIQHLINFSVPHLNGRSTNALWWNEAFSMAAEHMMGYTGRGGTVAQSRISDFNTDTGNRVRNGAILNFTDYGQNGNSLAANYGMPYLFGQYLRTQTKHLSGGGDSIYKSIIAHPQGDHRAIMGGLADVGYTVSEFDILHRNFRIAMVQKDATGYFGFAGESTFDAINTPLHSASGAVTLSGGAAIVRRITGSSLTRPGGAGSNIQFAGFRTGEVKSSQAIAFPNSNATVLKIFGDAPFTNVASLVGAGGIGDITYSNNNSSVASVNTYTGEITIAGVGTALITAVKEECENYMRAAASFTLTVSMPQPNITTQPANNTVSVGGNAAFSIAIIPPSAGITVSYQWQLSTNSGVSWSEITGATTDSYTTPTLDRSDDGNQYRCRVTFTMGSATPTSVTSSPAVLRVLYFITPNLLSLELPDAYWINDGINSRYYPIEPSETITFTNNGHDPLAGLVVSLGNDVASSFVITDISVSSNLTGPAAVAAISATIAPGESFTVTIKPKDSLAVGGHVDNLIVSGLPSDVVVPLSFSVMEPDPPKVLPFETIPRNRQVVRPASQTTLTIPFDRPMKPDDGLVTIGSGKGHNMTFNLNSSTVEWGWNANADSLEITLRPVVIDGIALNFFDTYIVAVSGFKSSLNVGMDGSYVFSFMTSEQNTNGNIRRIDVKGMRAVIDTINRKHIIEIPHYDFNLNTIVADDFIILRDSGFSKIESINRRSPDTWEISVLPDFGVDIVVHTVEFIKWGGDTDKRGFDFGINYTEGIVVLGRANRANDDPATQGYWYFVANNQHIVPGAGNFTQLAWNHATGELDLNTHLNASTVAATRTLHILDWTETNSRPDATQFAQAIRDGKLISIPLLRRATAAELSSPGVWHYEYADWEAINATQVGNPDRTVSLTGDVYKDANWEVRSSNSVANNNNLLATGTGIDKVNDNLVGSRDFDSFTVAERTRLSGNAARDIFVRLTGDQDKRLFASHVATLRIVADSAMTGNAGMSSANNVASFVNYAAPDPYGNGTRAVWAVPDSRYEYEYILRDLINFGDWELIVPGHPLPDELFTYNTTANPQFHVRRMACSDKNHPQSAPSVAFRFAPLRAPVNLAANSLNINTMSITGRSTAQEYIVLGKPYEELKLGAAPRGSVVNPNTDPDRDNRIANQGDIIQGWTRSPGTSIPIRPEWVTAGAYIYVRTAATAAAPAGMVGNLERRNSNDKVIANRLQLINPPINFENVAPRDFLFGLSDPDRDRVVGRLFVFNTTNGRFSLNTLANFPNEARIYGYTDRSAIQVSSNNEFWVAPGTSDLRPYMNLDGNTATLWVRIAGGTGVRPSVPMKLHIDIRTGTITSVER
jgi:hypothetical protein